MCATGSRAVLALVVLLVAATAMAVAADAPAIHQSLPNFSNAIATGGFRVEWSATPRELSREESIELTIRFVGVANPDRVRRPDLAGRSSFKAVFREIRNGQSTPPLPNAVSFAYLLKPRDESVRQIPELEVAYYDPGRDAVATKYLDPIPVTIRSSAASPVGDFPLQAPERFFQLPDPDRSTAPPTIRDWFILLAVIVAFPAVWITTWRYRNPGGIRLARLRRIRAVRDALDGLDRAERDPEPGAAAARVLRDYLAARFGAVAPSPTPGDIAGAMERAGLPPDRIDRALRWLRESDERRFSSPRGPDLDSVPRAREMILAWEART